MEVSEVDETKLELAVWDDSSATPIRALILVLSRVIDWPFEGQADLSNYIVLLNCFQRILEELLRSSGGSNEALILFPKQDLDEKITSTVSPRDIVWTDSDRETLAFELLRVSAFILENSMNKQLYTSVDLITSLIEATSERVAREAVKVIAMLSMPPLSHRHPIDPQNQSDSVAVGKAPLKKHLLTIIEGTGGGSTNLAMADYLNEGSSQNDAMVYQYYRYDEASSDSVLESIEIPHVEGTESSSSATILFRLIEEHKVPEKHHFKLLYRIRSSIWRFSKEARELALVERLHAFVALFYLFSDSWEVTQYIEQHPEVTGELLELVRMDGNNETPLRVRVASLHVLTALVNDKRGRGMGSLGRQSAILPSLGIARGAPNGSFVSLVRSCMSELVIGEKSTDMDMNLAVAFVQATTVNETTPFRDLNSAQERQLYWIESVLGLVCSVVSIQSGASALTECGIVPSLLHAISCPSISPLHTSILVQCIQAMELTMTNHTPASILFRDLNGVTILVDRLIYEISTPDMCETKRVLVISLLNMLSISFHTQGVMSAGTTSRFIRDGSPLNKVLGTILSQMDIYGPIVYSQAATLMADIINNDPTCVNHVHSSGLADAYLSTICRWDLSTSENSLPPAPELIITIPNTISALCLTSTYVDKVAKLEPLTYLMDMFTMVSYVEDIDYLQGDVASIVGGGLDELMRHVPALAKSAIEACVRAVKKIVELQMSHSHLLRLSLHVCDVLEPVLAKVEYATRFAENGGVDSLLTLYGRILPEPSTFLSNTYNETSPLSHYPAAQSITMAARAYTTQQPAPMLTKIMAQLSAQLDRLAEIRPNGAQGVMSQTPNINLADINAQNADVNSIGEYLRILTQLEWLVSLLIWTIRTAQTHVQNRRWFSDFTTTWNQQVLTRLFTLDRSIQVERMTLDFQLEAETPPNEKGMWKIGSLLLLKFSLMVRNLLSKYGRTFFVSRLSDDSVSPISVHAAPLVQSIIDMLQATVDLVMSSNKFVRNGALTFLLETLSSLLFEGKRGTANTLLAHACVEKKLLDRVMQALTSCVVDCLNSDTLNALSKQDTRLCQTAAHFLKKTADIQSLNSSPMTASLLLSDETKFDSHALKVQLHTLTMEAVMNIWTHPRFPQSEKCIMFFVPVVSIILKQRLDQDKKPKDTPEKEMKLDTAVVDSLTMMGFVKSHVELALRQIEANDVEMAMEWMLEHPEDEFAAQTKSIIPPSEKKDVPTYQALRNTMESVPFIIVENQTEGVVKAVSELLILQCSQSVDERVKVIQCIDKRILELNSDSLISISHLLALILHGDLKSRSVLKDCCCVRILVDTVVQHSTEATLHKCVAPILLIMDALTQDDCLDVATRSQLLDCVVRFMSVPDLTVSGGHSIWQLSVRLTRDLDMVDLFVEKRGVEACLNAPSRFEGYKELTSAILAHVMEYPEVLQARMEEKIIQSMKKLSSRLGSASQMRIQPRNLLSELGIVAMRNEKLFLAALRETIEVKKSDSGRIYVVPKEAEMIGLKKLMQLPIPNASIVMQLIVNRIEQLWKTHDSATGLYLFFLVHLVTLFPACGISLLNESSAFLSLVLREMLPCRELTHIMAAKEDKSLNEQAKVRVHNAHRLMVRLCSQEGSKKILLELCKLLESWPGLEENKTNSLSCLHAWCALMMSILWPREDKEKTWMWENAKTLLKKDIVKSLFSALGKVDLSHPLARSTCTMVLRPLASFTRPWVGQRLKKLKKRGEANDPIPPQAVEEEQRGSSDFEDIRMSNPEEEDEEAEEVENSSESSEDEENEDENEDDEEDADEADDDDDEEDIELNREDIELMQAEGEFRALRENQNPLWDALDADLSVLDDENEQNTHHNVRQTPQMSQEDARSIFDLFSFHHPPGSSATHRRPPTQWSHIFREFEQDLSNQNQDDSMFVLREFEDDDANDLTVPFDPIDRDPRRFRIVGQHVANSTSTTTNAISSSSLAGLTHPLLSDPREHRETSSRPPSRHHIHNEYSGLHSRHAMTHSLDTRVSSSWPREDQQSQLRHVVQRMEQELTELLNESVEQNEEDSASVQALTSTLGESSLQSPPDTTMSQSPSPPVDDDTTEPMITEALSPELATDTAVDELAEAIQVVLPSASVPPPAPVDNPSFLNFTLDLQNVPPPIPNETSSTPLVCPEGMDPEVFHSLPPDMQAEVVAANPPAPPPSSDIANSRYDRETLDALPPDIREEILANERREREAASAPPPDISLAQEMDNASFVASLAPDLREEILITSDEAFLQTLPSSVRAEAMVLRERAAFRSVQAHTRQEDESGAFFQRPTLRRMLTSHGSDLAASSRRSSRRVESRPFIPPVVDSSKQGMIEVEKDDEFDHILVLDENSIQHLLQCFFMTQSILHHRVFQTVLSNLCHYPTTRSMIRVNTLKILTGTRSNSWFPPTNMIGCGAKKSTETGLVADVISRVLNVLVALTKQNVRLGVDLLQDGLISLLGLLDSRWVYRNGKNLDMLLEVLEHVVSPLIRLAPKESSDDTLSPSLETVEWIPVPKVILTSTDMNHLVTVLSMDLCTTAMQARILNILKRLASVTENQKCIMDTLVLCGSQLLSGGCKAATTSAVLQSPQQEIKLLRLLHIISDVAQTTEEFTEQIQHLDLSPVWHALSCALDEARAVEGLLDENKDAEMVIEGKSAGASCAMGALLTRFLPMIEAFFVVNAREAAQMTLAPPNLEEDHSDAHATQLALFVEANRTLLNMLVREKPSLLESTLAAMIKFPRCRAFLDFDNKRTYFQASMKRLRHSSLRSQGGGSSSVRIPVRRDRVFEDSFYALRMRSGHELRRKLHISFTGEEGIDAGGVTREWYMILAREIFNPNYALFTSAADSPTFQPNPLSFVNKDHLSYFEFVGKVIGKAIADGQLLDAHFTRSFYKHILQLPISYSDMEAIDPEYYRNLHSILDNPIEDLGLDLTFSIEHSNFGKLDVVDLISNGRNIAVTDENKMEYVKLVTHHRMATGIRSQIDAFLAGFHQLVSPQLISIFNENELELLISGMPEIDIDDLKANTDYANYKPTDQVIRWFWNVMYSFTHEERALFIQFVTGTSKVPLEGFKALEGMRGTQKFNIHKAFGSSATLPTAHTCFNQLDLPEYENEEQLKTRLLLAIREGSEGFGFG
ncbi:Aste57867_11015 [Aphanomyces stellatus]|uniref:HECT-type E3 ubiquitin transferase n=1 Tax=Aphanomyces stellatus TaxID=120398 RepID=A0A485KSD1_9STRA|nr:hypothetical protein As57867_010974 [Aphanomyces stellatus]VFT87883.1 Aste57867_11015 [Aphanomyces stellatus]